MSKQFLDLSRITGTDLENNIRNVSRVFGDFSVASNKQAESLDYLFRASQATGVAVDNLASKMVQYGAPLRQIGFDFESSAAMLAKWEKEGVNTEAVLGSLKIALGKFAKAGKDPAEAFKEVVEQIERAPAAADAASLALETFGSRAMADAVGAIREGRFEFGEFQKELSEGSETIADAGEEAKTTAERLEEAWRKVQKVIEPVGSLIATILDNVAGLAGGIADAASLIGKHVFRPIEDSYNSLPEALRFILEGRFIYRGLKDFPEANSRQWYENFNVPGRQFNVFTPMDVGAGSAFSGPPSFMMRFANYIASGFKKAEEPAEELTEELEKGKLTLEDWVQWIVTGKGKIAELTSETQATVKVYEQLYDVGKLISELPIHSDEFGFETDPWTDASTMGAGLYGLDRGAPSKLFSWTDKFIGFAQKDLPQAFKTGFSWATDFFGVEVRGWSDTLENAMTSGFDRAFHNFGDLGKAVAIGFSDMLSAGLSRALFGQKVQGMFGQFNVGGLLGKYADTWFGKMTQSFLPVGIGAAVGWISSLFGAPSIEEYAASSGKSAAQAFGIAYTSEMDQWILKAAEQIAAVTGKEARKHMSEARWMPSVVGQMLEQMTDFGWAEQERLALILEQHTRSVLQNVMGMSNEEAASAMAPLFDAAIAKAIEAGEALSDNLMRMIDWARDMGVELSIPVDKITSSLLDMAEAGKENEAGFKNLLYLAYQLGITLPDVLGDINDRIKDQRKELRDARFEWRQMALDVMRADLSLVSLERQLWEGGKAINEAKRAVRDYDQALQKELDRLVKSGELTPAQAAARFQRERFRYAAPEIVGYTVPEKEGEQPKPIYSPGQTYMGEEAWDKLWEAIRARKAGARDIIDREELKEIMAGVPAEFKEMVWDLIDSINARAETKQMIKNQERANQKLHDSWALQKRNLPEIKKGIGELQGRSKRESANCRVSRRRLSTTGVLCLTDSARCMRISSGSRKLCMPSRIERPSPAPEVSIRYFRVRPQATPFAPGCTAPSGLWPSPRAAARCESRESSRITSISAIPAWQPS